VLKEPAISKEASAEERVGVKRTIDVLGSAALLIVLSPVIALVAALVALRLGRPVIFRHERPGRNATPFTLLKFRTMTDARGPDGALLPDEDRLTAFGRRLRATSLDELPELWNVLGGDMSLVGPRPLLSEYLPHYTPRQARRHEVRPGVTGWAQVNGRNDLPWSEKLELDVWYVEHQTLWLDIRILLRTLSVPFRRQGISRSGHATAPRFDDEQP
jgi:sugar transferase EpsL